MIDAVIFAAALEREHIARLRHDADGALVALRRGTDGARLLIGEILADAAAVNVFLRIHNGGCKLQRLLFREGQNMKRQPLRALAPDTGQRGKLVNEVFKCNPTTHKPSAKRTVERYLSAASAVFEYAIENRAVDFNPCRYVKIPKAAKTSERRALTTEERKWVEEMPHRAQLPAMLMMYSGLRKGEVTALLWSDIDFNNKTITVNKSFDFKQCKIKSPKTASGVRVVSVPDKLIDFLKEQPKTSVLVVTGANGQRMTETAWKRLWESYINDLNLKYGKAINKRNKFDPKGNIMTIEPFTPHCLRHTFCTIMYEAGIDVLTAKEQMGHSDVKTTLSIYTHLDKVYKKKNISKLDEYLENYG